MARFLDRAGDRYRIGISDALCLTAVAPPLPMPEYTVSSIWHATATDDPAHLWLRHLVDEATTAKTLLTLP